MARSRGKDAAGERASGQLGARIEEVVDLYRSRKEAAKAAGVSPDQLLRYIRGSMPPVAAIASLAAGKNVSINWVINGRGNMYESAPTQRAEEAQPPPYAALDLALLATVITTVTEFLIETKRESATPEQRAKLTAALYGYAHSRATRDKATMGEFLKLVV